MGIINGKTDKIGSTFEYRGKTYKVEACPLDNGCRRCGFNVEGMAACVATDFDHACIMERREDRRDVIFVEVGKEETC